MKIIFIFLSLLIFVEMDAVPRFALMRGNQCKDCHTNPTGGKIRNEDGWRYGKNNLKMFRTSKNEISPSLNENISIGFDFRYQYLYSQELKKTDFHKMAAGIYSSFTLSDEIDFVTTYDIYRGYFEGFGVLKVLPLDGYLKIGTFSPNFGVRLDDHTAYTRNGDLGVLATGGSNGLIFESGYSQTGIELGIYPLDYGFVTFSIGQDKFPFTSDPSYNLRFELTPSVDFINLLFGASYGIYRNLNKEKFNLTSLFGGIGFRRFSLLSEYVLAQDYFGKNKSAALMLETSYRLVSGLDLVARYDRMFQDTKSTNYFSHLILGLDFYPYSFVEIKPQYRLNIENPKIEKNDGFVMQFHFYF